ncbi:MAG: hypothetical protein JWM52_257 [Candidatus Saccharibacteria bacterium]|nr:hypothetical protein [Candidatus Saccharibacteria bacterium]
MLEEGSSVRSCDRLGWKRTLRSSSCHARGGAADGLRLVLVGLSLSVAHDLFGLDLAVLDLFEDQAEKSVLVAHALEGSERLDVVLQHEVNHLVRGVGGDRVEHLALLGGPRVEQSELTDGLVEQLSIELGRLQVGAALDAGGLAGLVSTSSTVCTSGPGIAVLTIGHVEPN